MPVNMDPKRKRKAEADSSAGPETDRNAAADKPGTKTGQDPNTATEADLAEKEWKNLWEATEVIDMDNW